MDGPNALQESRGLEHIFQLAEKLLKAKRIYHRNSSTLRGFLARFTQELSRYLELHGVLAVRVTKAAFIADEHPVYEKEPGEDSLPFLLYIEGIRELRILDGVDQREITRFFDILLNSRKADHLEDDLTTLLWEADLSHLTYLAAEDYGEELTAEDRRLLESLRQRYLAEKLPDHVLDSPSAHALHQLLEGLNGGPQTVIGLSDDERDRLRHEAADLGGSQDQRRMFEILLSILPEQRADEAKEVAEVLGRAFRSVLGLGDLETASSLLDLARQAIQWNPRLDEVLEPFHAAAFDMHAAAELAEAINRDGRIFRRELTDFFLGLPENKLGFLCSVMRRTRDPSRLSEALQASVKRHREPEQLLRELASGNEAFLRQIIRILLSVPVPGREGALRRLHSHPSPAVRSDALATYARIAGDAAAASIAAALEDSDATVRQNALDLISTRPRAAYLEPIEHRIHRRDFATRPYEEKRSLFEALVRVAGEESLEELRPFLGGLRHLPTANNISTRLAAIRALGLFDSACALDLLIKHSRSMTPEIRDAAQDLLRDKGL
ncbi:MAG: hypothetical protein RL885_07970 [Planctomycetota bacterium]